MSAARYLIIAAVLACDSPTSSEREGNVETGRASYVVEASSLGNRIAVDIRFTNPLSISVEWGHCGGRPAGLYKLNGSSRTIVAGTVGSLDCGAPGAVIAPGESYAVTIVFEGAPPGSDSYPQFTMNDLAGTYRIILHEVVVDRGDANPVGVEIQERYRTSNTFQVIDQ